MPRQARSREKRDELLKAAARIFIERGYAMTTADDIALAIVFLASDWAASITGEILNVNGGSVLCG